MRKSLLIGVVLVVLALGTMGAAFATGMNFSNVGALSLGIEAVPQINCDYVGFHLNSGANTPVQVDGVYLSFDKSFTGAAFSVSLRDYYGTELCYCAKNSYSQNAGTTSCFKLQDEGGLYIENASNTLPTPDQVFYVKVTVGENSVYNAIPAGGWVIGP
jgi:hypothetical protein